MAKYKVVAEGPGIQEEEEFEVDSEEEAEEYAKDFFFSHFNYGFVKVSD
ncbi:hypothetical protein [Rosenbergiella collisarenosi]|nr:hypothetical protein [Rosenbergiella collisarenosi]